jgi:hypothetical protein
MSQEKSTLLEEMKVLKKKIEHTYNILCIFEEKFKVKKRKYEELDKKLALVDGRRKVITKVTQTGRQLTHYKKLVQN